MAECPPDRWTWLLTEHHATYPHCHGYTPDGRAVVLASTPPDGPALAVVDLDQEDVEHVRSPRPLVDLRRFGEPHAPRYWDSPVAPLAVPWWDVALAAPVLVVPWANALLRVDVASGDAAPVWRPPRGWELSDTASVTADGGRAAVAISDGRRCRLLEIDLVDGDATELLEVNWYLNHVHHVPADERWIAFSHEGPHAEVADRVQAWHPTLAPDGVVVLDQRAISDAVSSRVSVGHERWLFHDVGALVPVYGDSPAGPRGLWRVHPDGRDPVLVSPGDRDWHVGVDRTGRWAVVDTTGPADRPGRGWAGADGVSSLVAVDLSTGARTTLAHTGFEQHPFHPHPSVTPDGTAVIANGVWRDRAGVVRRGVGLLPLPGAAAPLRP